MQDHTLSSNFNFSVSPNIGSNERSNLSLANPFHYEYTYNLLDENNNIIGVLVLSWLSSIAIIKSIKHLERKIHAISNEDFESTLNTQIHLKKPLREIESIANDANEIMNKMKTYSIQIGNQNKILESQNAELELQNVELIESRTQIENAKQKLQ